MAVKRMKLYKIVDTNTGLFSTGGYVPQWGTEGKSWRTLGQVRQHLMLYSRGTPQPGMFGKARPKPVPDNWVVIEYDLMPKKQTAASDVVRGKDRQTK